MRYNLPAVDSYLGQPLPTLDYRTPSRFEESPAKWKSFTVECDAGATTIVVRRWRAAFWIPRLLVFLAAIVASFALALGSALAAMQGDDAWLVPLSILFSAVTLAFAMGLRLVIAGATQSTFILIRDGLVTITAPALKGTQTRSYRLIDIEDVRMWPSGPVQVAGKRALRPLLTIRGQSPRELRALAQVLESALYAQ